MTGKTRSSVRKFWLSVASTLAFAAYGVAFAQEKPPSLQETQFRDFVVEGAAVGAASIELTVVDRYGRTLDGGVFDLKDGAFQGVMPTPVGLDVEIRAQALDARGEFLAGGAARVLFAGESLGAGIIDFRTEKNVSVGGVIVSSVRLQLESLSEGELLRYQLSAYDPYGKPVELDPRDVSWSVPFPEKQQFIPCKPSGAGFIPCIELEVPLRVRPEIVACLKDFFCRQSGADSTPGPGYTAISAGYDYTCALTNSQRIMCWGANDDNQLGFVATDSCRLPPPLQQSLRPCSKVPKEIVCASGDPCEFISLDAGRNHTCAIDVNRRVWCWGSNGSQQVGFSCPPSSPVNCIDVLTPHRVLFPTTPEDFAPKFIQVSAGETHSCALTERGNIFCWGDNVSSQAGGNGGSAPHLVVSASKYTRVSAGKEHSCAITIDGELECWGGNGFRQIKPSATPSHDFFPDPTNMRQFHPLLVGKVTAVAANRIWTCASDDVSGVVCWGGGSSAPDHVVLPSAVDNLELGLAGWNNADDLCAISGGESFCGRPNTSLTLTPASASPLVDTTVGSDHSCIVKDTGEAFCRGHFNVLGELGDGTTAPHAFFGRVLGP